MPRLRYPDDNHECDGDCPPSTMLRVEAKRVVWEPGDHRSVITNSRPIGRAKVTLRGPDGKLVEIDALLVASLADRTLGQPFAVFFTPRWDNGEATGGGHLVAVPMLPREGT